MALNCLVKMVNRVYHIACVKKMSDPYITQSSKRGDRMTYAGLRAETTGSIYSVSWQRFGIPLDVEICTPSWILLTPSGSIWLSDRAQILSWLSNKRFAQLDWGDPYEPMTTFAYLRNINQFDLADWSSKNHVVLNFLVHIEPVADHHFQNIPFTLIMLRDGGSSQNRKE